MSDVTVAPKLLENLEDTAVVGAIGYNSLPQREKIRTLPSICTADNLW